MDVIDVYAVEGFLDWLVSLAPLVSVGFLLALVCGVLAFGIFKLLALVGVVSR